MTWYNDMICKFTRNNWAFFFMQEFPIGGGFTSRGLRFYKKKKKNWKIRQIMLWTYDLVLLIIFLIAFPDLALLFVI